MITSITRPDRRRRARAMTLVEVIIGSSIGSFILLGVLSTFLMLSRSGTNLVAYMTMDKETRRALEEFAQDVRMASNVTWNSSSSVTLTVPDNYTSTSNLVTYAWDDTSTSSSSYHCFYRMPGDSTSTSAKTVYIHNVTSFTFYRFDKLNVTTTTDISTKRLQIAMTITSTSQTVVSATDNVVSASFILRNKSAS